MKTYGSEAKNSVVLCLSMVINSCHPAAGSLIRASLYGAIANSSTVSGDGERSVAVDVAATCIALCSRRDLGLRTLLEKVVD